MSESEKPIELETVACEICLKEIPKSEATIGEAGDYVLYFCGLDCYGKWQDEKEKVSKTSE
jgi:hypothetical protein